MKKLVMTVAVLACAASIVSAQTVTSANIVGYNKDVSAPGLHIAGYAFDSSDSTPEGVFGDSLSVGSTIYLFGDTGYSISVFEESIDWGTWPPTTNQVWNPNTLDLGGAVAFWVENNTQNTEEAVFSGEVPMDLNMTNSIAMGLQLISYPYPVERNIADLGFEPAIGDTVYQFGDTGYTIATYEESLDWGTWPPTTNQVWNPASMVIGVGEGFWYEAAAPADWIVNRPF